MLCLALSVNIVTPIVNTPHCRFHMFYSQEKISYFHILAIWYIKLWVVYFEETLSLCELTIHLKLQFHLGYRKIIHHCGLYLNKKVKTMIFELHPLKCPCMAFCLKDISLVYCAYGTKRSCVPSVTGRSENTMTVSIVAWTKHLIQQFWV